MLWEEMKKYTELTGEDATHVPIMKIGAYLDGYEKGTEMLDKIRDEIEQEYNRLRATRADETLELGECLGLKMTLKIIDKYIEGRDKE